MNILIEFRESDLSIKDKDFVDYQKKSYSTYDIPSIIENLSENEDVEKIYVNVITNQFGSSVIIGPLFALARKEKINIYFNGVDKDSVVDEKAERRVKENTPIFKIPEDKPCLSLYFVHDAFKDRCFKLIPVSDNRVNVVGAFSGPTGSRLTLYCDDVTLNQQLACLLKAPAVFLASKQKEEGMDACYYRSGETMAYLLSKYNDSIEELVDEINKQKMAKNKR